jgi:hypothetical protein
VLDQLLVKPIERGTTMKLSRPRIMLCCTLVIGLLAGWSLLGADVVKKEQRPVQQGFTADYVLIERQDGSRTVLERPHLGILGDKTYVVGRTLSLEGVTDDLFFNDTIQWVSLADVRRLAEVADYSLLQRNAEVARERLAKRRVFDKPKQEEKIP